MSYTGDKVNRTSLDSTESTEKSNHSSLALATSAILMMSALAQNIGVSLAYSDDVFLTTLRDAMEKRAKELGVTIQSTPREILVSSLVRYKTLSPKR